MTNHRILKIATITTALCMSILSYVKAQGGDQYLSVRVDYTKELYADLVADPAANLGKDPFGSTVFEKTLDGKQPTAGITPCCRKCNSGSVLTPYHFTYKLRCYYSRQQKTPVTAHGQTGLITYESEQEFMSHEENHAQEFSAVCDLLSNVMSNKFPQIKTVCYSTPDKARSEAITLLTELHQELQQFKDNIYTEAGTRLDHGEAAGVADGVWRLAANQPNRDAILNWIANRNLVDTVHLPRDKNQPECGIR